MTIRSRIFTVIGIVVAAALVQTWLVARFEQRRTAAANRLAAALERIENQEQLGRLIMQMEGAQRTYALSGEPAFRDAYLRLYADYERTINVLPQSIDSPDLLERLNEIDEAVRDWHHNASEVVLARRLVSPVTVRELAELNDARMGRIQAGVGRFESAARNRFVDQRVAASSVSLVATIFSLAVPALAIVMLLLLVTLLARIVLDPLAAVAQSARQISGGNFDVQLPLAGRDELGALIRAFKDMTAAVQRRQRELTEAVAREREAGRQNATLRAKAEADHARLAATVSTVPAAIVIIDASRRVLLQNRAAETLIGREPDDEEARAAHWRQFRVTTRDGASAPFETWGPARALQGEIVVGQELTVERPDGSRVPILMSAAPLHNEAGLITGAVSAFQDITSLYEVDRLKNEFVSIVSHELRTPLTSIKGALQLVSSDAEWGDPDHKMLVDVALSNTDRLIRIINDILDISKIEAGKLELTPRPCDVRDLVHASMQAVERIAAGANVGITRVIPDGLPRVMADPDRSVQALVNLLSNALKYAPPRSDVTLTLTPVGASHVQFAVSDRGRGIPADKLDSLFQKFQQIDGADTRRFRGTGLGLAITKALIERQGGAVGVTSTVGEGSTFTVTIPAVRA